MNEKIEVKYIASDVRKDLMRMLSELSDDAVKYARLPVLGAYLWTDQHEPEMLTDEEYDRFSLIGAAVHEPIERVQKLLDWNHYYFHEEMRKAGEHS